MRIKDKNILIRDLNFNDLKMLKEIRDLSLDYLDTQVSYSYEETCAWFFESKPKWYIIELQNKMIGYIRTSNYDNINKSFYVGLDLHPDFQGYGYAYQSYCIFLNKMKMQNYFTTYLRVQIINYKAYNLYRKLGFLPIGIIPNAVIKKNKKIDSVIMYKNL